MTDVFSHAITRQPGRDFANGITTAELGPPSYDLMCHQHQSYVAALRLLGLDVIELGPLPGYPDAHFVEDTAVVTPRGAIVTVPGTATRQGEQESIAEVLQRYRSIQYLEPPATVDGGDILMAGLHFFIGLSARTNKAGADQLGGLLQQLGYTSITVPVDAGLHLKSGANYLGDNILIVTEGFADFSGFDSYRRIVLGSEDAYAANCVRINNCVLVPAGFPAATRALAESGLDVSELDVSEVRKMDGGLTCMSLRF